MITEKLLKIKEVSEILAVSIETLRNWDKSGVLVPLKTIGKHRRYRESDIIQFMKGDKLG
jgi:putative resolvase